MPIFTIIDIQTFSETVQVFYGNILNKKRISPGDKIVFSDDVNSYIFRIIGVIKASGKQQLGLLISSSDYEKVSKWNVEGKSVNVVSLSDRRKLIDTPIVWEGDLSDDCTAEWAGLRLRAEWMDEDYWWWQVSDMENPEVEIDSSNNYDVSFIGGDISRQTAEKAAKEYLR